MIVCGGALYLLERVNLKEFASEDLCAKAVMREERSQRSSSLQFCVFSVVLTAAQ